MRGSTLERALRAVLVVLPVITLALHPIDSADIWFHLATGDLLARTHVLPATDPFGAAPFPRPWIVHDWLGSLILALVGRAGGGTALAFFGAALVVAALALPLGLAIRRRSVTWPYEVALLLSTLIAYERFFVRPELFTLFAASIWSAALVSGAPRTWPALAALALVQAAWTNLHAAFVLGPVLAAFAVAGDIFDRLRDRLRLPRPDAEESGLQAFRAALASLPRARLALPLVALLACLANPYGARLLVHLLHAGRELGAAQLRAGIVEWQPTFAHPIAGDFVLMLFVVSLIGFALAALFGRRTLRLSELLVGVAVIVLACTSRRHLALYAVVVPPLAAAWIARALAVRTAPVAGSRRLLARAATLVPAGLALFLTADVVRGDFYARFGPPRTVGWGFSSADHPIAAGDFVAEHRLEGPMFNNIAAGSYLVWRLRGTPPVLIDGRLLDGDFFARYRRCLASPAAFDSLASERDFQLVVLALQPYPPTRLFRHLVAAPAWQLVYVDGEGAVFVRARTRDAEALRPISLDAPLLEPTSLAAGEVRLTRACSPGEAWRRGRMLLQLGFPEPARADLARARLRCPERWDIGLALGKALVGTGRAAEAAPLLSNALQHTPGDVEDWMTYGACMAALGDSAAARTAWQRAAARAPDDPRPRRLLQGLRP
jgi:tetratricopeptide (TPR) repeat protein